MKKIKFILFILIGLLLFGLYRLFIYTDKSTEKHVFDESIVQTISTETLPTSLSTTMPLPESSSIILSEETVTPEIVFDGDRPSEKKREAFYFSHLLPEEQSLYLLFYDYAMIFENTIEIESYQFNNTTVYKIIKAMLCDSPELFWLSEAYRFYTNDSDIVVRIEFSSDDQDTIERALIEINAIAESWIQQAAPLQSDYEKVKFFYEQIIRSTDYVLESENNQDIRSVFLQKESVCAGYARALQYLLNRVGIYNLFVNGEIKDGNLHAWNMIRLDEKYYWVDPTWGDPVFPNGLQNDGTISYNYLCITDDEIFRTHSPLFDYSGEISPFFEFPVCNSTDYDYYRLYENYLDTFDYDMIVNTIVDDHLAGNGYYMVKCASKELWEQLYSEISEGDLLQDVYKMIDDGNRSGVTTAFYYDDEMYTIKIILFS